MAPSLAPMLLLLLTGVAASHGHVFHSYNQRDHNRRYGHGYSEGDEGSNAMTEFNKKMQERREALKEKLRNRHNSGDSEDEEGTNSKTDFIKIVEEKLRNSGDAEGEEGSDSMSEFKRRMRERAAEWLKQFKNRLQGENGDSEGDEGSDDVDELRNRRDAFLKKYHNRNNHHGDSAGTEEGQGAGDSEGEH